MISYEKMKQSPSAAHIKQGGFTMIEIIAVLILLSILAATSAHHMADTKSDVYGSTEVIKGHLRFAQVKAMNTTSPWGIRFANTAYTLEKNAIVSTILLPSESTSTSTLPAGITVSSTVNPLVFDQWGSPGTTTATVTVTDGTNNRTITVTKNTGAIQ